MLRRGGSCLRAGRWLALAYAGLALLTAASDASGQGAASDAREVFRAGLSLEAAGDWAGALVKFREVSAQRPTPQVRFHMARCQEQLGKWLEALGTYRLTVGEAEALRADDVRAEAEAARVSLEAKMPSLLLRRAQGSEAVTVKLDGVELGETSIGKPLLVDPGPHSIELFVRRAAAGDQVVMVKAGEKREIELRASARAEAEPSATPRGPAVVPAQPGAQSSPEAAHPEPLSAEPKSKTGAYVLLGAGGALAASSAVFLLLRQGTLSDLDQSCVGGRCPRAMQATADRGKLYTWLSAGTGVAAAAALGTGAALLLMGPSSPEKPGVWVGLSPHPSQLVTATGVF